jgi:fatty acid-binding protein DegV
MTQTVKDKLRLLQRQEMKKQEERERERLQQQYEEEQQLKTAQDSIRQALEGFEVDEEETAAGHCFTVQCQRPVYVFTKYEVRNVRYADDMPEQSERILKVVIDTNGKHTSRITSVESFADVFADYILNKKLV